MSIPDLGTLASSGGRVMEAQTQLDEAVSVAGQTLAELGPVVGFVTTAAGLEDLGHGELADLLALAVLRLAELVGVS
jgi:hypothetical protein